MYSLQDAPTSAIKIEQDFVAKPNALDQRLIFGDSAASRSR